ncbi:hypothetical protein PRIPAC_92903, partial [Pristionchus pacificus]|uniref:Uncharacterized protein n=1 Tax=Pristionchus pacificus TaxID=54126 RepID=A0A2A6BAZ2_PRIPA
EHICCSRPLQCPPGLAALREKSVPRVCTIGVPGTCPPDHLCVRGVGEPLANGAASLCCKPDETCAAGANYLGGAQRCTPGDGRCPLGTRCLSSSSSLSTKAVDLVFECCLSTVIVTCPDGTPPLRRPRNHSIVRCTSSSLSDCPSTFTCDQLSDDSLGCCSIPQEECIEAFSLNGIVLSCKSNADCPKGSCTRSSDGKHYCCIEKEHICCSRPLQCPPGLAALREKSVPRVCTIGVPGTCPPDHLCVRGVGEPLANGAASLCCKPDETCAAGANYLGGAQRCTPGDGRCPLGTRCLSSSSSLSTKAVDLVFECCLSTVIVTCPDGTPPLRRPRNHSIVRCTSSSLSDCPSTFTCDQLSDDSLGCCSIPQEECIEAFSLNGIVLSCKSNADCPKGSCTRSSDGKHYCCIEKVQLIYDALN